MNELKHLVEYDDIRKFLQWDVIRKTMFVNNPWYIQKEFINLKKSSNWKQIKPAIKESRIGKPTLSIFYPKSSGNLIHQAFHIAQLEERSNTNISELDSVLEFGGGYGCMCKYFYNRGFTGKYIIYDLPAFSAIQRYYLKANNLPITSLTNTINSGKGIVCISELKEFHTIHDQINKEHNSLFIATWSLSETSLAIRNEILNKLDDFDYYLFAYQAQFGEMDNISYFRDWCAINNLLWENYEIEHLPNNYYLIGKGKIDS